MHPVPKIEIESNPTTDREYCDGDGQAEREEEDEEPFQLGDAPVFLLRIQMHIFVTALSR